jgi:Family of unknown function (DUF5906)
MGDTTPFEEIAHDIAAQLNFEASRTFQWPIRWPHTFRVIEPELGARVPLLEAPDQEIRKVKLAHIADRIIQWTRLQDNPEVLLTKSKAKQAAEVWQSIADPLDPTEIKNVRWKSDVGYTWRRLPWDLEEGPTPTWDKVMSKMSNSEAFRHFIGSLFFDEAKQHQYVWAHGLGGDGKGSMNRFLKRVFGASYRSKQPPAQNDKFWTHGLIGARLVVFPDCNSQGFTTGGLFKSLSGGDPVDVEAKQEMSFTAELQAKFLFLSNEKPNVSCETADMRRIIYCGFERPIEGDKDPTFEAKLWAEGGYFLSKCANRYIEAHPNHEDIKSDDEQIKAWVSTNDEKFQNIFDALFMQPNEKHRSRQGLRGLTEDQIKILTVEPKELLAVTTAEFKDHKDQRAFKDWLYKKYGVEKIGFTSESNGMVYYRYIGMHTLKTAQVAEKISRHLSVIRVKTT